MTDAINQIRSEDTALRQVALGRLKKQSDFWLHLMIYRLFALKLGGGLIPGRHAGAEMR